MISANGGLPAHRYTPQVTPGWPRGSEPASQDLSSWCLPLAPREEGCWALTVVYHFGALLCGYRCRVLLVSIWGSMRCAVVARVDSVTDASCSPYSH